jgi:hypothetical protein
VKVEYFKETDTAVVVQIHIKGMLGKTVTRRPSELVLQLSSTAHIDPR